MLTYETNTDNYEYQQTLGLEPQTTYEDNLDSEPDVLDELVEVEDDEVDLSSTPLRDGNTDKWWKENQHLLTRNRKDEVEYGETTRPTWGEYELRGIKTVHMGPHGVKMNPPKPKKVCGLGTTKPVTRPLDERTTKEDWKTVGKGGQEFGNVWYRWDKTYEVITNPTTKLNPNRFRRRTVDKTTGDVVVTIERVNTWEGTNPPLDYRPKGLDGLQNPKVKNEEGVWFEVDGPEKDYQKKKRLDRTGRWCKDNQGNWNRKCDPVDDTTWTQPDHVVVGGRKVPITWTMMDWYLTVVPTKGYTTDYPTWSDVRGDLPTPEWKWVEPVKEPWEVKKINQILRQPQRKLNLMTWTLDTPKGWIVLRQSEIVRCRKQHRNTVKGGLIVEGLLNWYVTTRDMWFMEEDLHNNNPEPNIEDMGMGSDYDLDENGMYGTTPDHMDTIKGWVENDVEEVEKVLVTQHHWDLMVMKNLKQTLTVPEHNKVNRFGKRLKKVVVY